MNRTEHHAEDRTDQQTLVGAQQVATTLRQWVEATAARVFRGWQDYVRATGLSLTQFGVLIYIGQEERREVRQGTGPADAYRVAPTGDGRRTACSVSEVARQIGVSGPAASQLVDRLVQSGYVIRTEDPHDRRARQLRLTGAGRSLVAASLERRFTWIDRLAERLDDRQRMLAQQSVPALTATVRGLSDELPSQIPDSSP